MMKPESLHVKTRLLSLVAVVILGMGILTAMFLFDTHGQMMLEKKAKIRNVTEAAYSVVECYYAMEQAGTITREGAQT